MEQQTEYQVVISEKAKQMLVLHAGFLAKVSLPAAERFVTSFEQASRSLCTMPQRCPWLMGDYIPKMTYRSLLFEKRYMLIFRIQENIVFVDYVIDCRQDYKWLIS